MFLSVTDLPGSFDNPGASSNSNFLSEVSAEGKEQIEETREYGTPIHCCFRNAICSFKKYFEMKKY